jgi:uncharacterized protein (TIGR02145 family)
MIASAAAFAAAKTGKAMGLQIFNTKTKCVETWNGTQWIEQCGGISRCTVKSTLPPGYLTFMCYNLGADPNMTITEQMAYPSPTGNDVTDATVYGDLYQWGRKSDGHQLRTSAAYPTNDGTSENGTVSGVANLDASTGQITLASAVGKFVKGNASPFDWRSPQIATLWHNGTATPKTVNDPCPEGWRVPTQAEWGSIIVGGTTSVSISTSWTHLTGNGQSQNSVRWNSTSNTRGIEISTDGGTTVSLFLPAAGYRSSSSASLGNAGTSGYYWSTTVPGTNAYDVLFNSSSVYPGSSYNRTSGLSVRCLAEY